MVVATVLSDSDDETFYRVSIRSGSKKFQCECPHHAYRKVQCKHIKRVKTALKGKEINGVFLTNSI
jgi:hypothetical protein